MIPCPVLSSGIFLQPCPCYVEMTPREQREDNTNEQHPEPAGKLPYFEP
jgi:hypothetical protein